eukprot:gene11171-14990_t
MDSRRMNNITKNILCFGDSLTAGYYSKGFTEEFYFPYAKELQSLLGNSFYVNHIGLCGWTTEEMVEKMNNEINYDCFDNQWKGLAYELDHDMEKHYDYVFILAGTNDLGTDQNLEDILLHADILLQTCLKRDAKVGILTVPSCSVECYHEDLAAARTELNNALYDFPKKYGSNVFVIDIASALPNGQRERLPIEIQSYWAGDGLHLTEIGSKRLATIVFETFQQYLSI